MRLRFYNYGLFHHKNCPGSCSCLSTTTWQINNKSLLDINRFVMESTLSEKLSFGRSFMDIRTLETNKQENPVEQRSHIIRVSFYAPQLYRQVLLRRVLARGILSVCLSVCPSVCHNPVVYQAQVR